VIHTCSNASGCMDAEPRAEGKRYRLADLHLSEAGRDAILYASLKDAYVEGSGLRADVQSSDSLSNT
jgi:hypothetical protein